MRIFFSTISLIVFGVIFLIVFSVSAFMVNISHDAFNDIRNNVDTKFGEEIDIMQTGLLIIGCIFICAGVIDYIIRVSVEEPDEYFEEQT